MTKRIRLGIGCATIAGILCGLPVAWFALPAPEYPIGASVSQLGITPLNSRYFIWSPDSREPIAIFARRNQVRLAHFSGSLELNRPGSAWDRIEFHFLDGKLAYHQAPYKDSLLDQDFEILQKSRLPEMLARTKNDWRINNHNNHSVDPDGPFTGQITINKREGFPFSTVVVLEVHKDRITRSRRSILVTID